MEATASRADEARQGQQRAAVEGVLADRAISYRLFSRLFLRPLMADEIDSLAAMDLEVRAAALAGTGLLAEGFNDMGRGLHRRHTGTQRLLSTDYTMTFDGVRSHGGLVAAPYASVFNGSITGEKAVLYQEPRARDLKAYRREGVEVDSSLHLPEDHLGFELSFMADLSDRAAEAVRSGSDEEALRLVDASLEFLRDDILCWYGSFCDLALKLVETRFYRGVLKAAQGYLLADEAALEDLRATLA